METHVIIEQLERKLALLKKKPLLEMDVQRITVSGNATILSNALSKLGIKSACLGSKGFLKREFLESDLIAFVDWANLINAESIWEEALENIIKPSGRRDFLFFFDLCDPSKKSPLEIDEILDVISSFSFYGKVTLGLNQDEAMAIWSSLTGITQTGPVEEAGRFIHYAMDIDRLLIHPIDRTIVFLKKETISLPGRIVTKPRIQTGGGDNLNAGYILGLLSGFSLEESMVLGMAASGCYIQEGRSATLTDLEEYLGLWKNELRSAVEITTKRRAA